MRLLWPCAWSYAASLLRWWFFFFYIKIIIDYEGFLCVRDKINIKMVVGRGGMGVLQTQTCLSVFVFSFRQEYIRHVQVCIIIVLNCRVHCKFKLFESESHLHRHLLPAMHALFISVLTFSHKCDHTITPVSVAMGGLMNGATINRTRGPAGQVGWTSTSGYRNHGFSFSWSPYSLNLYFSAIKGRC